MLKSLVRIITVLALLGPGVSFAQGFGPSYVYPLLVNASASGNLFAGVYGGNYQLNLAGTVGGATVTVTVSDSSGTQITATTFTAIGTQCIAIPANASLQANVSGGSPSGLYLKASAVGSCPSVSSGGTTVVTGNQSNAGAGTTGSTNVPVMAYNYYWNGASWVQFTGISPAATPFSGQVVQNASATAISTGNTGTSWTPSSPTSMTNGILCKARVTNTGTIYIGPSGVSSSNGYPLNAGDTVSIGPTSAANIYSLDSVTTDVLACTGS